MPGPQRGATTDEAVRTGEEYLLPLEEISASDRNKVGSKAANLGELARAGFPVPEGMAVTTSAFGRFMQTNGWKDNPTQDIVVSGKIPDDIGKVVTSISKKFGETLLAVRSSGVAEDLAGASFAGQYETVLGIKGEIELQDAIKKCWASTFSPRVTAYSDSRTGNHEPRIGVLVQRLVRAEAAGVAFTADPINGDRGVVVVNSVKGLGERLVSGRASPDEWHVRGFKAICRASPEKSITAEQARQVAELARRVEKHFDSPQDIEWAISGDKLYLLQARPITALKAPEEKVDSVEIPIEVPEGYWFSDEEHFGNPISCMEMSITIPSLEPAMNRIVNDFGLPFEGVEMKAIGGYLYGRFVPPGGKDRSPPPSWLMPILVNLVPQVRVMNKKCVDAVRSDKRGRFINSWYGELQETTRRRIDGLSQTDLAGLSDEGLQEHVASARALYAETSEVHMKLVFGMALPLYRFSAYCGTSLAWKRRKILEMLDSEKTSEPSRRLEELAKLISGDPKAVSLLQTRGEAGVLGALRDANPGLARALSAYMTEYCCLTVGYDVSMPTIEENPSLVIRLVREELRQGNRSSPQTDAVRKRRDLIEEARGLVAKKGEAEREKFEQLLGDASRAYSAIDGTQFYLMRCRGLVRRAMMEVGRRLGERGLLTRPDDVFFLEIDEARDALKGTRTNLSEVVRKRKGERNWALAHPGPKSYGTPPGPPPSMKAFPFEVQEVMNSFNWMLGNVLPSVSEGAKVGALSGLGASSGRYTGPVCLVKDESEFGKVKPGDVLVCRTTAPTWTTLFSDAGAVVTDLGGLLSHPAIIAREYGIPAVIGTGNATRILRDGEIVTVDGDAGVVRAEPLV